MRVEPEQQRLIIKNRGSTFDRQQWGLLLLLAAINFTHILDFVIVMPLGDPLRQQLKINPQQFGMVVSAYGIAAMIDRKSVV